jgi:hydroxymethylglutaryl-CoA lyase
MQPTDYALQLIECPRDAMQGIHEFIPTAIKVEYLNLLLEVGFDVLDFGSFVSAKAIPQLKDTKEVLEKLVFMGSQTKLLAIVANLRGAEEAAPYDQIKYLGFPFSVSETFQQRNTNSSIAESFEQVERMQELCLRTGKEMVLYLSMGFGNPYGEAYSPEIVAHWVDKLASIGVGIMSLSDTVGVSTPENIKALYSHITPLYPKVTFGVHLHSHPATRDEKIAAAYESGCRRFDGALLGFGGCPMATDDMVGNMATENLIAFSRKKKIPVHLNIDKLHEAQWMATGLFSRYH